MLSSTINIRPLFIGLTIPRLMASGNAARILKDFGLGISHRDTETQRKIIPSVSETVWLIEGWLCNSIFSSNIIQRLMKILYIADGRSPIAQNWIRHFVERGDEVYLAST